MPPLTRANNPSRNVPFWHLADEVLSWINV
jgi:hypothetical protein